MQAYRAMVEAQGQGGELGAAHAAPDAPPLAVAVFAADTSIRSLMEQAGPIARWTEFDRGGHFPAMEVPDLLAGDLREFFRPLR